MKNQKFTKVLLQTAILGTTTLQLASLASPVVSVFADEKQPSTEQVDKKADTKTTETKDGVRREKIPFNTKYTTDDNLNYGEEKEVQPGIEGEKEFITKVTPGVKAQNGKATGTLSFVTKAPENTNVTTETKPTVLVGVMDFSSSYARKLPTAIDQMEMLINKAITNKDSKVILQIYTMNYADSYSANTTANAPGWSTVLLTKDEAIKILEKLKALKSPILGGYNGGDFGAYFRDVQLALGDKNYKVEGVNKSVPYEQIIEEVTKKSDNISVIQFTDGWNDKAVNAHGADEHIDDTFATWAKSRAKTFMSVINRNKTVQNPTNTDYDTNTDRSINEMKRVGHPNIYEVTGKDKATVDKELLNQFMETAVEKVTKTKGEDQTAKITISGKDVKVTKATLKGAQTKELTIKDGKVDVSEKLPDGNYTVDFDVEGNGTAEGIVTINGKEVNKKSVEAKAIAGTKDQSTTEEKIVKEPQDRIIAKGTKGTITEKETEKIPYKTEYVDDENLEYGKTELRQEGVQGENEIIKIYQTKNGEKVGEPEITKNTITEVKNKIIARGTKKQKVEEPKKEEPKKPEVKKETPKQEPKKEELPKTNDTAKATSVLAGISLVGLGITTFVKRKFAK